MIVTLLTDFGTADYFVGALKGAVLAANPSAQVVDITHESLIRLWTTLREPVELRQVDGRLEAWVPANVAMLLKWSGPEA